MFVFRHALINKIIYLGALFNKTLLGLLGYLVKNKTLKKSNSLKGNRKANMRKVVRGL